MKKNYKKLYFRLKYNKIYDENQNKYILKKRNLVNLDYDLRKSEDYFENLTPSQKREITYYYNLFFGNPKSSKEQGLINDDVYFYRPRNDKNKKIAGKYAGVTKGFKKLKVIPLPRADKNSKIKLKFKKNKLILQEDNIYRSVEKFNLFNLALNPNKEIERVYNKLLLKDAVQVTAGYREVLGEAATSLDGVKAQVISKMQRYSNYDEWLYGLTGYGFEDQADYIEYALTKKNKKKKRKKKKIQNKNK